MGPMFYLVQCEEARCLISAVILADWPHEFALALLLGKMAGGGCTPWPAAFSAGFFWGCAAKKARFLDPVQQPLNAITMGKGKRCGSCSACIAKKKKKGRKRACEHPIGRQNSEAERLDWGTSPAMFRLPQEPEAVPLEPRRNKATGSRHEAKPSSEKGLDPKAATQIRHLKQQSQELDTKVAGAFALLLFCSFALGLAHCL